MPRRAQRHSETDVGGSGFHVRPDELLLPDVPRRRGSIRSGGGGLLRGGLRSLLGDGQIMTVLSRPCRNLRFIGVVT